MHGEANRALWVVIITLVGALSAVLGAVLLRAAGADLPTSVGGGGAAFTCMVTVGLKILQILSE
jgi:hypothetical protein